MAKIPKELQLSDEQMQVWNGRIVRAFRSRLREVEKWERVREFYKGNYFSSASKEDRVSVFWTLSTVRQMGSALYFQNPRMNFTPLNVKGVFIARVMEQVVAKERQLIDAENEERKALFNTLLYGTGIIKHAWNTEFGLEPAFAKSPRGAEQHSSMEGNAPAAEDLILDQGPWTEHNTNIAFGHPWVKSIHPIDFLIDPEAITYEEARWVAHRFRRPWIEARDDERWDDEARKELQPTGRSPFFDDSDLSGEESTGSAWRDNPEAVDSSLVTFYEIWDKSTQRIIVISAATQRPLSIKPYPFFGKDGPYQILQFFPRDDSFWAIPYADTFADQVLTMNKMRTKMVDHLQRYGATKGAYKRGSINKEDAIRFAQAKQGDMVEVNVDDITKAFKIYPHVPIAGDAWRLSDLLFRDFQLISGVSELALGGSKGIKTATEANLIQQQTSLRIRDMRYQVDRFLTGSTRKLVSLLRQFWKGQQVVPIVGEDGQIWDAIVNEDVMRGVYGEYDVAIEPGSTERVDRNARMRQHIELMRELTNMKPHIETQGKTVDLARFAVDILRDSDVVKNPERYIIPLQPQPVAQPAQPAQGGGTGITGSAPPPTPAAVNSLDQVIPTRESFRMGRNLSEIAGSASLN